MLHTIFDNDGLVCAQALGWHSFLLGVSAGPGADQFGRIVALNCTVDATVCGSGQNQLIQNLTYRHSPPWTYLKTSCQDFTQAFALVCYQTWELL